VTTAPSPRPSPPEGEREKRGANRSLILLSPSPPEGEREKRGSRPILPQRGRGRRGEADRSHHPSSPSPPLGERAGVRGSRPRPPSLTPPLSRKREREKRGAHRSLILLSPSPPFGGEGWGEGGQVEAAVPHPGPLPRAGEGEEGGRPIPHPSFPLSPFWGRGLG
jgi:hypothetical protein